MTKPVIVNRAAKGTPLTLDELDTNFTNLQDATITLTAGTGGTGVTADLNGNITLVAGAGVTLTGDNTAKTITIVTDGGWVGTAGSDLDMGSYNISSSTGSLTLNDDAITLGTLNTGTTNTITFAGTDPWSVGGYFSKTNNQVNIGSASGSTAIFLDGPLKVKDLLSGAPVDPTTPVDWIKVMVTEDGVTGTYYYIPYYS